MGICTGMDQTRTDDQEGRQKVELEQQGYAVLPEDHRPVVVVEPAPREREGSSRQKDGRSMAAPRRTFGPLGYRSVSARRRVVCTSAGMHPPAVVPVERWPRESTKTDQPELGRPTRRTHRLMSVGPRRRSKSRERGRGWERDRALAEAETPPGGRQRQSLSFDPINDKGTLDKVQLIR